jgi:hypothetical protein
MILTRKVALAVAGIVTAGVLGTAGVAAATATSSAAPPTTAPGSTTPDSTATGTTAPGTTAPGSTTGTTGTGDTAPDGTPGGRKHREGRAAHVLLTRGLHGEWVVKGKDGTPVTLASVRGSVTAVGPTSVTVEAEDGYTATFATNGDTKVRGAGVDSLSDVKVGARGAVVGVKDGTSLTARTILVRR